MKNVLEINREVFEAKYLGLPTPRGRIKGEHFQDLKERLGKRLMDYSERFMSAAAKEVLIKSVAQALRTYIMSVFKLPLGFVMISPALSRASGGEQKMGRERLSG